MRSRFLLGVSVLLNIGMIFVCFCGREPGNIKKKHRESELNEYNKEAANFVTNYKAAYVACDLEMAKNALIRDWSIGSIKLSDNKFCKDIYLDVMVFAAERLRRLYERENAHSEAYFWAKFRDKNAGGIKMTSEQVIGAVTDLDQHMGVDFTKIQLTNKLDACDATSNARQRYPCY